MRIGRWLVMLGAVITFPVLAVQPDMQIELSAQSPTSEALEFVPRDLARIPNDEFGRKVRRGFQLFVDTQQLKGRYVGNGLNCTNCHLSNGAKAYSAPLWAAYLAYPIFRAKDNRIDTYAERIQGCFNYSMNGKAPAVDSAEVVALSAYSYWLLMGGLLDKSGMADAPVPELSDQQLLLGGNDKSFVLPQSVAGKIEQTGRTKMPGRAFTAIPAAESPVSPERGQQVYLQHCAVCHGPQGEGRRMGGVPVLPALWGAESFNWGAGMQRINTAAAFIYENMPLGRAIQLNPQQAWDVAAYINSRERPQDPRFDGNLISTAKKFHSAEQSYYGQNVDGDLLGNKAYPTGIQP